MTSGGAAVLESALADGAPLAWKEHMEREEKRYVKEVLSRCGGQVSAASTLMGLSRKSVYEKINRHAIDLALFRQNNEITPPRP